MGKTEYLGHKLNPGTGLVVFLFGEDAPEEVNRRARLICGGQLPPRLMLIQYDGRPVDEVLTKEIGCADVELLVIDPARKFYKGDEDNSDPVNTFLNEVGKFITDKGAATVIVHHLKRYAKPHSTTEVVAAMRGSQALADRPRVILGLHRIGDVTILGVGKHNLDAAVMMKDPKKLKRDATTFRHVPIDGKQPATDTKSDGDVERVRAVLARLRAEGKHVTGTGSLHIIGADTLFKLKAPELAGMSRTAIRNAMPIAGSPNVAMDPRGEGVGEARND
jgi:hypothetical protein